MELMKAIEQRRTVRDFEAKPVPEDVTKKALYAGLKAPSYNHQKEVYFTLVKDPALRLEVIKAQGRTGIVTEDMKAGLKKEMEPLACDMYLDAIPKQNSMLRSAAELLVVSYKPKTSFEASKSVADLNCHAAVWACIENILLSLTEDDVYGTTLVPDNTPAIKAVLGIPQQYEIAALLPFGYKADNARIIPQKDVSVDAALHINRWE